MTHDTPMKTLVYIHGLNSSHRSFSHIRQQLPEHNAIRVNYDSHQHLSLSITQVMKQLPKVGEFSIIGHSLGGLIGTLIADDLHDRVSELITISAPLGGSRAANIVQWFPRHPPVIENITTNSLHIQRLASLRLNIPTLCICSTGGHIQTSLEPNDSIVTVSSQKALKFGKKVEVKANHFEILMHEKTINLIRNHIFDV